MHVTSAESPFLKTCVLEWIQNNPNMYCLRKYHKVRNDVIKVKGQLKSFRSLPQKRQRPACILDKALG